MASGFESYVYVVQIDGNYVKITKSGVSVDPESGKTTYTELNDYFYPVGAAYIQSIFDEDTGLKALMIINGYSRGTFVFSQNGFDNSEYVNADYIPYDYDSLRKFLTDLTGK